MHLPPDEAQQFIHGYTLLMHEVEWLQDQQHRTVAGESACEAHGEAGLAASVDCTA